MALLSWIALAPAAELRSAEPLDLGGRLELFADDFLLERLDGTRLQLHEPRPAEVVLRFDRPWEGPHCGYVTVIQDEDRFRMYYRGLPESGKDGSPSESTCYAESTDGIAWTRPDLGLFEVRGTRANNVVLGGKPPFSHNFSPFLDKRPGVPHAERLKAVAGTTESGLHLFASGDGIHWSRLQEGPVLREGAFDSQNVAFWSESEGLYALYLRTWSEGEFRGFRTVSRSTSPDLVHWSKPAPMGFGNTPMEHLYTSQTQPYFRAPHLYLAFPMRFVPGRKALTEAQAESLGVRPGYASDCAETVFMTSRGGTNYSRLFLEGFIRPGMELGNWASRAGFTALGVIPTGPGEISLYKLDHYAQPSIHLTRHRLRTDGFVSIRAPFAGGTAVTRPLRFSGRELVVNFATGAAGGVRIALEDAAGKELPGFSKEECVELIGDEVERVVAWKGNPDLSALGGRPVRVRFWMKDADLFSLRFR
ncbi:MAG TPA: hypothetical protein DCM86_19880 [Verrucomicrobiales bacterium]|nr:hypothetical protein [Verrucomicrobiales bacterium]